MASQKREDHHRIYYIYEMERLYRQGAYSDAELGERLGTDRTNIYRIRKLMTEELGLAIVAHPEERGKYYLLPGHELAHIFLSREEAAALYLAGRRLQQQTRTGQHHVANALEKLSTALGRPLAEKLVRAAAVVLAQEQDPQQEAVFATLVRCWLEQIPVRITHRTLHGQPRRYLVHPYQIEPSVWGDGNYLIGYSDYHGKLATFKIARIERAVPATGTYTIPEDFDIHTLLNHAWGIWHADDDPVTVRLRFSRYVTPRVRETIWHPQELLHVLDDGSSEWSAPVAQPREMVPWIRGWGADCEVMEPTWLRQELAAEARRLAVRYGVATQAQVPRYQRLWAKANSRTGETHPLICHLIDVAQAALALWEESFTEGLRQRFAQALNLDVDAAGRTLAFWVGLHDLGKASPGFQRKYKPAVTELEAAGLPFPPAFADEPCYHATITTCTLGRLLAQVTGLDQALATSVAWALGGHHGAWPTALQVRNTKQNQIGDQAWDEVRRTLVEALQQLLQPAPVTRLGADQEEAHAVLTLFSGWVSVADWIGSMEDAFPFAMAPVNVDEYGELAAYRARRALRRLRWDGVATYPLRPFTELFPFQPNDLQKVAMELADQIQEPALVIIEASTGQGKTEAAFYLAARWGHRLRQRGLYVAMPTMATSNQMHRRTRAFLQALGLNEVDPLLIHSQARWLQDAPPPSLQTEEEPDAEAERPAVLDMQWFLPRKRSLLAPFGVGTVDQGLLSVLQTRHFFVRLFGLGQKTLIFDEVHAYDTYMNHLFRRLLGWLRAMGTSVILLSATLPARTREEFVRAYLGDDSAEMPDVAYPAITWATRIQGARSCKIPEPPGRLVQLRWIDRSPQTMVDTLQALLQGGGCAAVICNTVGRAQALFQALQAAGFLDEQELLLFHARTPLAWRDETERAVVGRFGKDGQRPQRAVVVATQVIEQSLDLDFDVMISDLAPVDLLLQRMGRLHRHERDGRPEPLAQPTLYVAVDVDQAGVPAWENDGYVYEPYVLFRSYLALRERRHIATPQDTAGLIEAVYGDGPEDLPAPPPAWVEPLERARMKMEERERKAHFEATRRLVPPPDHPDLLWRGSDDLQEENPAIHDAFQALTRLGPPTLSLVCLHRVNGGLYTEPDGSGPQVELDEEPDSTLVRALAMHTVQVSHQGLVRHFLDTGRPPTGWQNHPLLRNHHVVIFEAGEAQVEGLPYRLRLDRTLGLEILRQEPA
ncbi:MAG: hypothetical protein KatS3mg050_1085 [Litorilinea sp.]|nr:MAG: hypothetical protein KatS3mg050_1085 [Litorilinea sp.]